MSIPSLYTTLYDAIAKGELSNDDYLYLRFHEGVTILAIIPKPNALAKIELWLKGYRLILSGSEVIRLYNDCYSSDDFCQTIASL